MNEATTYSTNDLAQIARVSLRQLQWWDEKRIVRPAHVGHNRVYDTEDALEIALIAELRRRKYSLAKIRKVTRIMKMRYRRWAYNALEATAQVFLVTDGQHAHVTDGDTALNLMHEASRECICLSLTKLVASLKTMRVGGKRLVA